MFPLKTKWENQFKSNPTYQLHIKYWVAAIQLIFSDKTKFKETLKYFPNFQYKSKKFRVKCKKQHIQIFHRLPYCRLSNEDPVCKLTGSLEKTNLKTPKKFEFQIRGIDCVVLFNDCDCKRMAKFNTQNST